MIRETSYFPTFLAILAIDVRSDRRKKNSAESLAFPRFYPIFQ